MEAIPKSLQLAFQNKRLIPIVGAGVSMSLTNKAGVRLFPSWTELLKRAAEKLRGEGRADLADGIDMMAKLGKYQAAADLASEGLKGPLWSEFFRENFNTDLSGICPNSLALPKAVWTLGSRVISLNYDKVMRFASSNSGTVSELDNSSRSELATFLRNEVSSPAIWHIHGRVDATEHIVFTSQSYNKLYAPSHSAYETAITTLKALASEGSFIFVGCSLDDAEFLQKIAMANDLFNENIGPHFALVKASHKNEIQDKLKGLNFRLITFDDFGPPLLHTIERISGIDATARTESSISPIAESSARVMKAVILIAEPIDKNYSYDNLLRELKGLSCRIEIGFLNFKSLQQIEDADYLFVLSNISRGRIVIENEHLSSDRHTVSEIEEHIADSTLKGIFYFIDAENLEQSESVWGDMTRIVYPTAIIPRIDKKQLASLSFKLFKKHVLEIPGAIFLNKDKFKLASLGPKNIIDKSATPLPIEIDIKTVQTFVGRRTDLSNLARKLIEMQGKSELLTIKGSGGIGKTTIAKKLAVEVAARNFFKAGIKFLDCEFIGDYKSFEIGIASCFGFVDSVDIREHLLTTSGRSDCLLILDNVETLLHRQEAKQILGLISTLTDHFSVLVTSRELLDIDFEQYYELRQFTTDEALELFARQFGTPVSEHDVRFLREQIIENLLDNNPLAIKLVTRNVPKGKSLAALKDDLERDLFDKISDGELKAFDSSSDINIQRKRSIFASINYSYQYLTPKEKNAFEVLSLFPDGINIENLKSVANSASKHSKSRVAADTLLTDSVIRALENKSMIQVDNGIIKLQSIVGRFAEYQFGKRNKAEKQRYYKSAYEYSCSLVDFLEDLKPTDQYNMAKIVNSYQNNLARSIDYAANFEVDEKSLVIYLRQLHKLTCTGPVNKVITARLIAIADQFAISNPARKAIEATIIACRYYGGTFEESYQDLNELIKLSDLDNIDWKNQIERSMALTACNIYNMEGNPLPVAKFLAEKMVPMGSYPSELFQLGEYSDNLMNAAPSSFVTLEYKLATGTLDSEFVKKYLTTIYEKTHLEITQTHYILSKISPLKTSEVKELIAVNPYTSGLKCLMLAFSNDSREEKVLLFEQACAQLTHIKYYYVEALYFFAKYLFEQGIKTRFEEIYEEGLRVATKCDYRYHIHRFRFIREVQIPKYKKEDYRLSTPYNFVPYMQFLTKELKGIAPVI